MPISFTQLTGDGHGEGSLRWQVRHSILAAEYCLERAQEAVYSLLRVREMVTRATAHPHRRIHDHASDPHARAHFRLAHRRVEGRNQSARPAAF
jgi:hypothetical protein